MSHRIRRLLAPFRPSVGTLLASGIALLALAPVACAHDGALRILAYGDSNTWGWQASDAPIPTSRLPQGMRWTGVLQSQLGEGAEILENGLNLRTTDLDDPLGGGGQLLPGDYNGARTLPGVLAANAPLDLVIIALGQNDLQDRYGRAPEEVADAIDDLVEIVRRSSGGIGTTYAAPNVLVLAPIPLGDALHPELAPAWTGAQAKSQGLAATIASHGAGNGYAVLDVSGATGEVAGIDGLHLTPDQHAAIAGELAQYIAATSSLARPSSPSPME